MVREGRRSEEVHDGLGRLTLRSYRSASASGSVTTGKGTSSSGQTAETRYDAANRRSVKDRKGYVTAYDCDPANPLVVQRDRDFGSAVVYAQSTAHDDARRTETAIDRRGIPTVRERDGLGRVVKVRAGRASSCASMRRRTTATATPCARWTRTSTRRSGVYDGANRRIEETRAAGSAVAATMRFGYDRVGNRTETKGPRETGVAFDLRKTFDELTRWSYDVPRGIEAGRGDGRARRRVHLRRRPGAEPGREAGREWEPDQVLG